MSLEVVGIRLFSKPQHGRRICGPCAKLRCYYSNSGLSVVALKSRYTAVVIEAARLFLKFAVDQWNQTTNQCGSSEAPVNSTRTLHAAVWPNVRVTAKFNNTNQMTKKLFF